MGRYRFPLGAAACQGECPLSTTWQHRWSLLLALPITILALWPTVALSGIGSCSQCQPTHYFFTPGDKGVDAHCPKCSGVVVQPPTPRDHAKWNGAALSLFHKLAATPENHVFSPHSLFETFAMLAAGAAGKTQSLTLELMGATPETYHQFSQIVQSGSATNGGVLSRYNAIAVSNRQRLKPDYKNFLQQLDPQTDFQEGIDFNNRDTVLQLSERINTRVKEVTNKMIEDCIGPAAMGPQTILAMINACYFQGVWREKFDKVKGGGSFYTLDNGSVDVPMLKIHNSESISYSEYNQWVAVSIPYEDKDNNGKGAEMVIVLPPQQVEPSAISRDIFANLQKPDPVCREVTLTMPEYLFEMEYALEDYLEHPVGSMFSLDADFSQMVEYRPQALSTIKHRAKIQTDRTGTRVAGTTRAIVEECYRPGKRKTVTVDRPFLFFIQDRSESRTIRFMGQVWNPVASTETVVKKRDSTPPQLGGNQGKASEHAHLPEQDEQVSSSVPVTITPE